MTGHCECCHVQLVEGAPVPKTPGLCSKCDEAWEWLPKLAPTYQTHVLAAALCHSKTEIARRLDCTPSAHASGINNATIRTKIPRGRLIRVAGWALLTERIERPQGMEDCNPNGWAPACVRGTSEVKTTRVEPQPTPRKASKGNAKTPPAYRWTPRGQRATSLDQASPATDPAEESTPQPGASQEPTPPSVGAEPPAPIVHCAVEGVKVDEATFNRMVEDALAHPDITSPVAPDAFTEALNRLLQAKRNLDQRWLALVPAQQEYQRAIDALAKYGQVA